MDSEERQGRAGKRAQRKWENRWKRGKGKKKDGKGQVKKRVIKIKTKQKHVLWIFGSKAHHQSMMHQFVYEVCQFTSFVAVT